MRIVLDQKQCLESLFLLGLTFEVIMMEKVSLIVPVVVFWIAVANVH